MEVTGKSFNDIFQFFDFVVLVVQLFSLLRHGQVLHQLILVVPHLLELLSDATHLGLGHYDHLTIVSFLFLEFNRLLLLLLLLSCAWLLLLLLLLLWLGGTSWNWWHLLEFIVNILDHRGKG